MVPSPALLERFNRDLDALIAPQARIGIAVSGGSDSLALLLLAAAARPGFVEAATVDHALRAGSGEEAQMVARVSDALGVPHATLTAEWRERPLTAIQERARDERYRLLSLWASDRQLAAVLTAHHCDDQAETFVMRLARGSGVRGLSSMRPHSALPGSNALLLRPLLDWPRSQLEEICRAAGLDPVQDPSNFDQQFERVRVRRALKANAWLSPSSIALSASNLRKADTALEWAATKEWKERVKNEAGKFVTLRRMPREKFADGSYLEPCLSWRRRRKKRRFAGGSLIIFLRVLMREGRQRCGASAAPEEPSGVSTKRPHEIDEP